MLSQIKASAGSGKTYELTRRYMEKLASLTGDARKLSTGAAGILAVTFTNAAANEMRERVIRRLKLAALTGSDELLDKAAASQWLDILLRDLSSLNIRTIDSLLHQIVRASALDLDLLPEYDTIFDTTRAMRPTLDFFIDEASADGEYRALLREVCSKIAIEGNIVGYRGNRLINTINMLMEGALLGMFSDLASETEIRNLQAKLPAALHDSCQELADRAKLSGIALDGRKLGCLNKIISGSFPVSIPKAASENDPEAVVNSKSKGRSIEIAVEFERFKTACTAYYEYNAELRRALGFMPFIDLVLKLSQLSYSIHKEEGTIAQSVISSLAREVLSSGNGVTDAMCRLGSRLTHFLVDEFQDTSPDQWLALRSLVMEAMSRGGTFTWVGDVKQSIYSFRGADPDLFDAILEDDELVAISPQFSPTILESNWRSLSRIVDFNNNFFSPLKDFNQASIVLGAMLKLDPQDPVVASIARKTSRIYADIHQKIAREPDRDAGYIAIHDVSAEIDPWQAIIDGLIEIARKRHDAGRKWSDILVLVDSNRQAGEIAAQLLDTDIPVITVNSLLLAQNPLVVACISFLRFMNDSGDEVALFSLLESELVKPLLEKCAISFTELMDAALQRGEKPLDEWLREFYPELFQYLFGSLLYSQPLPYDLVTRWLSQIRAFGNFPDSEPILRSFLEVLHQAETNDIASISAFLDYWQEEGIEEKLAAPTSMDAVRVMTIHKSKGLEAPVVMVAGVDFKIKPSDRIFIDNVGGLKIPAFYHQDMGSRYQAEKARKSLEALNMLYVATTRATEELYLFTNIQDARNPMHRALQELMDFAHMDLTTEWGSPPAIQKAGSETPARVTPSASESAMPRLNIYRNHVASGELTAAERGTIMHASLERLDVHADPHKGAAAALADAMRRCRVSVPDEAKPGLLEGLVWYASLPEAKTWMDNGLPEQPLMDADGNLLRADLIVPMSQGPLVIDFKTGDPQDGHVGQVRRYMQCLADADQFEGEPRGLLVYLDHKSFRHISKDSSLVLEPAP